MLYVTQSVSQLVSRDRNIENKEIVTDWLSDQ